MNVNIGLVQMSCVSNLERNLEKGVARVRQAAASGAHIICLPELFKSEYFCQSEKQSNFSLAEDIARNELGLPPKFDINLGTAPAAGSGGGRI